MNPESKLVLGTVNFGMKYGYLGENIQLENSTTFDLIEFAIRENICFFDTAQDYGESEKVIGQFLRLRKSDSVKVITKFLATNEASNPVAESLSKLGLKSIYAVLFHSFDNYLRHPESIQKIQADQEAGRVEKIGFSLYLPSDLKLLLDSDISFEILQIPYSVFDRRFEPFFFQLREKGVEIHARSIFLNGLFFQNPTELGSHFDKVRSALAKIRRLSDTSHVSIATLCLNFVSQSEFIDKLVVGVRSIKELQENLEALRSGPALQNWRKSLSDLRCGDQDILHPHEWVL